ncbi:hypothetical protein DFH09DRAFT_915875 [Mycena vulgaris]|nr:hypothetical protein DFH09DRAFT_915875 [Mycena vulgaris]
MFRKVNIDPHWTMDRKEWEDAVFLVRRRQYKLSIDQPEALVLKWMFKFTKMNMPGTGYKMRIQTVKALQARSQAIHNVLARYNAALNLPGQILLWNEVINYTFLLEWDILRDLTGNADPLPWASPAARVIPDTYFKIKRTKEEVGQLNVEIHCFVTYIQDKRKFWIVAYTW